MRVVAALIVFGTLLAGLRPVAADEVADFYRGRTITLLVGLAPGGNYDMAARLVGKHLVRHLPGAPGLVVQNMPGGGGIAAINHLANIASREGEVLAVMQRALPQLALLGESGIRFEPAKLTYLGTLSSYGADAFPIFIMADRPVQSVAEIRAGSPKKIILGAVGSGSTNLTFPLVAKQALHLNIEIIRGYSGAAPIYLAMQRGEVDGQAAGFASVLAAQKSLYEAGKLRMLVQFGRTTRLPQLADVPTGQELAASAEDRALIAFAEAPFFMAMPFIAPPEIPAARARALQQAFEAAAADPALMAEAAKFDLDVSPLPGEAVAALVRDLATTPRPVVEQFKTIAESR